MDARRVVFIAGTIAIIFNSIIADSGMYNLHVQKLKENIKKYI